MAVFYSFLYDEFVFEAPISGIDLLGALIIASTTISVAFFKLTAKN